MLVAKNALTLEDGAAIIQSGQINGGGHADTLLFGDAVHFG